MQARRGGVFQAPTAGSARAVECGAHAHAGGTGRHRQLKVAAHAHGQLGQCDPEAGGESVAQFAQRGEGPARVLGPGATARLDDQPGEFNLVVDPGEPRFGTVFLTLPDPEAWADAINGLNVAQHA